MVIVGHHGKIKKKISLYGRQRTKTAICLAGVSITESLQLLKISTWYFQLYFLLSNDSHVFIIIYPQGLLWHLQSSALYYYHVRVAKPPFMFGSEEDQNTFDTLGENHIYFSYSDFSASGFCLLLSSCLMSAMESVLS